MIGFALQIRSRRRTTRVKYPLRYGAIFGVNKDYLSRKELDEADEFSWAVVEAPHTHKSRVVLYW